jgi:hypothetical protein
MISEATAASSPVITAVSSETTMEGKTVMPPSSKFVMYSYSVLMSVMQGRFYPSCKK